MICDLFLIKSAGSRSRGRKPHSGFREPRRQTAGLPEPVPHIAKQCREPRNKTSAAACKARRLVEPRRETRRGFCLGPWKPQVPGAAEETEGFRGVWSKTKGAGMWNPRRNRVAVSERQNKKLRSEYLSSVRRKYRFRCE